MCPHHTSYHYFPFLVICCGMLIDQKKWKINLINKDNLSGRALPQPPHVPPPDYNEAITGRCARLTSHIIDSHLSNYKVESKAPSHTSCKCFNRFPQVISVCLGFEKTGFPIFGKTKFSTISREETSDRNSQFYALLKVSIWRTSLEFLHIKAYGQVDFIE